MAQVEALATIRIDSTDLLPDNDQWKNRFQIRSSSSNRIYVIAQHKTKKHWGCSCPGWKIHRNCIHLKELGLACYEQPQEIEVRCE